MSETSHKIYLIDGSGFIFRAYHALPPLSRADGTPVGAVYGFTSMLLRFLDDVNAEKVIVIFDSKRENFRHNIYPEYKAHRPSPPEDLIPQFAIIREACAAFSVPVVEKEGYEADDIIATYTKEARSLGHEVIIVSSDKDLMQLVGEGVSLFDHMKNKKIGPKEVLEKFGVLPEKVIDVQALAGDSTDNIPGVPGIGVKTAAELIETYGSLEMLLQKASEIKQQKRRESLLMHRENALISKKLVTLMQDVPLEHSVMAFEKKRLDLTLLCTFLEMQGFKALLKRFLNAAPSSLLNENSVIPKVECPIENYTLITKEEDLKQWAELIERAGRVAVDTETTSLKPLEARLVGISLAIIPGHACYIPIGHGSLLLDRREKQLSLDVVKQYLNPIFENPSLLKVGHNIKYDLLVLENHGFTLAYFDDTMLMSYLTHEGRHGLDALAEKHFDHKMISYAEVTKSGREKITFDQVGLEEAKNYAAEDADYTLRLHDLLKPALAEMKVMTLYKTLEQPLIRVIAAMEKEGIAIKVDHLKELSQAFGKKLHTLEAAIYKEAGAPFNVASPKQLGDILFEKMGLPGGKKTKTGAYGTGSDVLEKLASHGSQLASLVLEWRQFAKLKSTYTDALPHEINPKTGRVHTSYGMAITSTGRLSSSDPNLQNIPIRTEEGRAIRSAFIPKEGCVFLSYDYSQIELRLLAHVGEIEPLITAFKEGRDIHALTASQVFGVPLHAVDGTLRRKAKAINFGIIYGMSAFGLAEQLSISRGEAAQYIETYKKQYPGIPAYMEKQINEARQLGYVTTLMGRKCFIPMINAKNPMQKTFSERQAINAPLQGSAADIIKKAMIEIDAFLKASSLKTKMLLQVHDELIFEVPEEEIEKVAEPIRTMMSGILKLHVPLDVGLEKGHAWGDFH